MANGNPTQQQPGNNSSDTGGAAGQGVTVSLEELDRLISTWKKEYDSIKQDGDSLNQSAALTAVPTDDVITVEYIDAIRQSILTLSAHNRSMSDFSGNYTEKLTACRDAYSGTTANSAASFNGFGI
jgi:hypothetical protein